MDSSIDVILFVFKSVAAASIQIHMTKERTMPPIDGGEPGKEVIGLAEQIRAMARVNPWILRKRATMGEYSD